MVAPSLVGAIGTIWVSDPWDWGTDVGDEPVSAEITRVGTSESSEPAILVKLLAPRLFKEHEVEYLVGQPRYIGTHIVDDLAAGKLVHCGFTHLTKEQASTANPFDLSWWRAGIGLIGSMKLKPVSVEAIAFEHRAYLRQRIERDTVEVTGARKWAAVDRTDGPVDAVFDRLRSKFENLTIERLVMPHPGDDDNVYWLTIGKPSRFHGPETVQVDTHEGGRLPFMLEGDRNAGEWIETDDLELAISELTVWLERRAHGRNASA